jgi:hypothetical protein
VFVDACRNRDWWERALFGREAKGSQKTSGPDSHASLVLRYWPFSGKRKTYLVEVGKLLTTAIGFWSEIIAGLEAGSHIITSMRKIDPLVQRVIVHVNRKEWWHVPPSDSSAYNKRGKFLASSFREAEFWGRPLDEPQRVAVSKPLIGDEETIERKLFGRRVSSEDTTMEERWKLDAKMRRAALRKGNDSLVLMAPKAFAEFQSTDKLPRSKELNVLNAGSVGMRVKTQSVAS